MLPKIIWEAFFLFFYYFINYSNIIFSKEIIIVIDGKIIEGGIIVYISQIPCWYPYTYYSHRRLS